MTPADLKTRAQAIAAAEAVNEARLVVGSAAPCHIHDALFDLEQSFWKRADELRKRGRAG